MLVHRSFVGCINRNYWLRPPISCLMHRNAGSRVVQGFQAGAVHYRAFILLECVAVRAMTTTIAFSKARRDMISRGLMSFSSSRRITAPTYKHSSSLPASSAGVEDE